ncbi:MAG: ParB/RepB/Spo0J family partition protein [Aureliella sp.]
MTDKFANVEIENLNRDHTQLRVKMSADAVEDYSEAMRNKRNELPPVVVYHDPQSGELFLADGYHRTAAAERLERKTVKARVVEGTLSDAILYAANCNKHNAVRFTNADKRKAVLTLLETFPGKPQRWIAEQCGVTQPFVSKVLRDAAKGNHELETKRTKKTHAGRFCEAVNAAERMHRMMSDEAAEDYPVMFSHSADLMAAGQKLAELVGDLGRIMQAVQYHPNKAESDNGYQDTEPPAPKPKRQGRRPKRFRLENHNDGWYVVDSKGEITDEGPIETKAEAEERRKEANKPIAAEVVA